MAKIDTIFHEIISDPEMVSTFDYKPDDYPILAKGAKSSNKYVKAIANMLLTYDKKVEEIAMNMRIRGISGQIVVDESVKDSVYRKFVKDLE